MQAALLINVATFESFRSTGRVGVSPAHRYGIYLLYLYVETMGTISGPSVHGIPN
jgi:hypothetical protein